MKKEVLILVLLIAALSAYLVFKKDGQQNYTLPEPVKIEKNKIDRLIITQKNIPIELIRTKDTWAITDNHYPADMAAVNDLLSVTETLKVSGLISESSDTRRYELDDDHSIQVKAFKGKEVLRSFKIGKTAPSGNHTFIMLQGDTRIYQADKPFKNKFETSVEELRDKRVLTFTEDDIQQITIEKGGITTILTAVPPKTDTEKDTVSWTLEDGSSPDQSALTNLLSSLSALTCEHFSNSPSKADLEKKSPLLKITIENSAPIVLTLFDQNDKETLNGISSMSPYPFVLESYKGKDILSYADKLAGLDAEAIKTDKE
jgi:Domain of unknown function (DUF4340)